MAKYTGEDIRKLRTEANLNQTEVAEKLGLSQGLVSAWETGRVEVSSEHQMKLAKLFGVADVGQSNVFGGWVKREREKRNLTVQELADKSGLSAPAIYNIERGTIASPRKGTRDSLARALDSVVPTEVADVVRSESEVEGLGLFTDFDPYDKDDLPTVAGVYVFYDVSERPVYVGQGQNIGARIKAHHDSFWFKFPIVDTASFIEIKEDKLRIPIETLLIKFLKSNAVINKQNVQRD